MVAVAAQIAGGIQSIWELDGQSCQLSKAATAAVNAVITFTNLRAVPGCALIDLTSPVDKSIQVLG